MKDRSWDFEGRCSECAKPLNMIVRRLSHRKISLEAVLCEDHPDGAMILWPQRDDIIDENDV